VLLILYVGNSEFEKNAYSMCLPLVSSNLLIDSLCGDKSKNLIDIIFDNSVVVSKIFVAS